VMTLAAVGRDSTQVSGNAARGPWDDVHLPDKWLSLGFALIGGYGDAAGFILGKTFTGHVTGNLVLAPISLVAHDWRAFLAHLSAVACFLAGIPLSVLVARLSGTSPFWQTLTTVLVIEVILIVAAYLALTSRAASAVEIFVICLSLALGLQNGAFRRTGGISVHTTYLTGMITGLIASETEKLTLHSAFGRATALDPNFKFLCGIWGVFVLGAAMGAAAAFYFRELGILGAALILFAIVVQHLTAVSRTRPAS
jgi:uncharacterized membrane protein YoaK (UPF0700 family)